MLRATIERMRQDPGECPVLACDRSCVCATATGMATNGGCRCDKRTLRRAVMFWRMRAQWLTECVRMARDDETRPEPVLPCADGGPGLRPHGTPGWWQVWSGHLCIALLKPEDVAPLRGGGEEAGR
jgi:hypothetical protein